ncbi:MaoC family dehydratase [Hoeflea sp. BAL378]|uniref:MaoC family dehydratase n=1 Tax=Hoeflea sp. BAL378 TaxID=1547437 RepID=UPI000B1DE560|nr:MaoC family dehydratase [Hoeflea sp. BAL378]
MKISGADLMNREIPRTEQIYTARDTMLYALGLGLGLDPLDPRQLSYVYEDGLRALPTMAAVLAQERSWFSDPGIGLDTTGGVEVQHGLTLHRPLQPAGALRGETRITDVLDKGAARGAIVAVRTDLSDAAGPVATSIQTIYFRRDGGCGGSNGTARPQPQPWPAGPPDISFLHPTSAQSALIYRLSGDDTSIHASPAAAAAAGFDRPILHGLATYGIAAYAVIATCCDNRPERLTEIDCSFTAPVFPGETLRIDLWRNGGAVRFRVVCAERDVVVADQGRATFARDQAYSRDTNKIRL